MQFLKPTDIVDIVLQYAETEKANDIARDVCQFVNRKVEGARIVYGDEQLWNGCSDRRITADTHRARLVCVERIEEIPKEGEK